MNEKALSCANFVDSGRERKIVDGCMMRYLIPWFFEGSGTSSGSRSSSCVVRMQVLPLLNFSFVLSSSSAPALAQRHVQFLDHFSFQVIGLPPPKSCTLLPGFYSHHAICV
jgi:hypothetical protein